MQDQLGPTEFFSGAMTAIVTRKVKLIKVIVEPTTFAVLTFQFPATPANGEAVNPATLAYDAMQEIRDVASFKLATGGIQVIYSQGLPNI